ncbi:MAG: RsmB/NOP family class I SAM-dependent RNA methyltransferase [Lentisphaeria bacterium]
MKKTVNSHSAAFNMFKQSANALERWEQGNNLNRILREHPSRSLLANLLYNLFRHRAVIDWIIDQHLNYGVEQKLRNILRIALTDILYLQGAAPEVITDVAVRYTKNCCSNKKSRFINAVLRNILREGAESCQEQALRHGDPAVRLELSTELYQQWKRRNSEELESLSKLLATPAPLIVRAVNRRKRSWTDVPPFLQPLPAPEWAKHEQFFRCTDPHAMFTSEIFHNGELYLQDPATLLAVNLLIPSPGETIADLCCAPGGKAVCIAEKMAGEGTLLCLDRSFERLKMTEPHIADFPNTCLGVARVEQPPLPPASLDAILLDVPCSNTGVIRRRPDIRWHFSRANLANLITIQQQMLATAVTLIKPGGRIVYSTCSIEEEENRLQIQRFVKEHSEIQKVEDKALLPASSHDGAYAALLTRL